MPSVVPGQWGPYLPAGTTCEWIVDGGGSQVVTWTWAWAHVGVTPPARRQGTKADGSPWPCAPGEPNSITLRDGAAAPVTACWFDSNWRRRLGAVRAGSGGGASFTTNTSSLRVTLVVGVEDSVTGFEAAFTVAPRAGGSSVSPAPSATPSINCTVSAWSVWGQCSLTCGGGLATRTRHVTRPATGAGSCMPLEESQACNTQPCQAPEDTDCVVSAWSKWSACLAPGHTCGPGVGTHDKSRHIVAPASGSGIPCPAPSYLTQTAVCDAPCVPRACNASTAPHVQESSVGRFGIGVSGFLPREDGSNVCEWGVDSGAWARSGEEGVVNLTLTALNLPTSSDCSFAYLRVMYWSRASGATEAALPDMCGSALPTTLSLLSRPGGGLLVRLVSQDGDTSVGFGASYAAHVLPSPSRPPSASALPSVTPPPGPPRQDATTASVTVRGGSGAAAAWRGMGAETLAVALRADLSACTGVPPYRFTGFQYMAGAGASPPSLTFQVNPPSWGAPPPRRRLAVSRSSTPTSTHTGSHSRTPSHTPTPTRGATVTSRTPTPSRTPAPGTTGSGTPTPSPTPLPSAGVPGSAGDVPVASVLALLASQLSPGRWAGSPLSRGALTRSLDGGTMQVSWASPAVAELSPSTLSLVLPYLRPPGAGAGMYTTGLRVTNTGGSPLVISGVDFAPAAGWPYPAALLSLFPAPAWPVTLPGSSTPPHSHLALTLTVDARGVPPGSTGAAFAVFTVRHSDPSGPASLPLVLTIDGGPAADNSGGEGGGPSPTPTSTLVGVTVALTLLTVLTCYCCVRRRADGSRMCFRLANRGFTKLREEGGGGTTGGKPSKGGPPSKEEAGEVDLDLSMDSERGGKGKGGELTDVVRNALASPGGARPTPGSSGTTTITSGSSAPAAGPLFGGLDLTAPPAAAAPASVVRPGLRPKPSLKPADFEAAWLGLTTVEIWGETLAAMPAAGELERALSPHGIACMASGAVAGAGATKFYFYGEGSASGYAIAEVTLTHASLRLTAIVKAPAGPAGQALGGAFTEAFKEGVALLTV